MSAFRRNLFVGVTVLAALAVLGVMILRFGAAPARWFGPDRIPVTFETQRAEGIGGGSQITFMGVNVGRVEGVRRTDDGLRVIVNAQINETPPVPGNVRGFIRATTPLSAAASISLEVIGDQPEGALQSGQVLELDHTGAGFIPPEMTELAAELRAIAQEVRRTGLVENVGQTVTSLRDQVERAGDLIDSLNSLVSDEQIRDDLREAIANLREATATADRVGKNLERFSEGLDDIGGDVRETLAEARGAIELTQEQVQALSGQIGQRLEQTSRILDDVQSITRKLDEGEGTMGQLVNDTRLHEALVESARELSLTIRDLRRLVEQWEQEGVRFRLN